VPALGHAEAAAMATMELSRFLALLEGLSAANWTTRTACPLWNVREVAAHVTGAAASYACRSEFARQWNPLIQRLYWRVGLGMLDAANQVQVDDRAQATPSALIAELREVGPRAITTRRRLPRLLRSVRLPMPLLGLAPIGYLTDVIYTRDMWVHRLDICQATGRTMTLTPEHDGRMIALIARDLAPKLTPLLREETVIYELTGSAGGRYRFGQRPNADATIRLNALDFVWLAAGRLTPATAQSTATIAGDEELAGRVIAATRVPF
jgi:uncharacterized protein (TIGR03083 family)